MGGFAACLTRLLGRSTVGVWRRRARTEAPATLFFRTYDGGFELRETGHRRYSNRIPKPPRVVGRSQGGADVMAKSKTASKAGGGGGKRSLSKSALVQAVTEAVGDNITRKQVKTVIETLADVGHKELKKIGEFTLPGFAKFKVRKTPAKPAREGINPFTKQKQMFAAKPAGKKVTARPVKAIKEAVA